MGFTRGTSSETLLIALEQLEPRIATLGVSLLSQTLIFWKFLILNCCTVSPLPRTKAQETSRTQSYQREEMSIRFGALVL